MIVKLQIEHHLEFLSLKGGCRGSSDSTNVKMSNRWKCLALALSSSVSDVWFQKQRFTVSDTKPLTESTAGFLCGFFKGPITDHETENPVTIRCRSPMVGRYVRVTATDSHVITLCELEVYTRVD